MPTKAEINEILNSIDELPKSSLYDNDDYLISEGIVISEDMVISESQIINEGIMSWLGKSIGGGVGSFFLSAFKGLTDSYRDTYGVDPDKDPEAAKNFFGVDGVKQLALFMKGYAKDLDSIAAKSKAFLKLDPSAGDKIKNILKVAIKDGQAVFTGYADKIKDDMVTQFNAAAGQLGGGAEAASPAPAAAAPAPAAAAAPAAPAPAAPAPAASAPAPAATAAEKAPEKKPVSEMTPEERAAAATAAKAKKEPTPAAESHQRKFNKLSGSGIELIAG